AERSEERAARGCHQALSSLLFLEVGLAWRERFRLLCSRFRFSCDIAGKNISPKKRAVHRRPAGAAGVVNRQSSFQLAFLTEWTELDERLLFIGQGHLAEKVDSEKEVV